MPASSVAVAKAAAVAASLITDGTTRARIPAASTAGRERGVGRIDHEGRRDRRVQPGDADDGGLVAELGEHAVGRSLERGASDDR